MLKGAILLLEKKTFVLTYFIWKMHHGTLYPSKESN
jgi:hypothetical protein